VATNNPGIDAFHKERSKCVDAFADLEAEVAALLVASNIEPGKASFGLQLGKLAKVKASPKLSKAKLAMLTELVARRQSLNAVRNDVVHARLKLTFIDDQPTACFVNPYQQTDSGRVARLLDLAEMRVLTKQVSELAESLRNLQSNPASSPPQPSPGAAGAP